MVARRISRGQKPPPTEDLEDEEEDEG